MALCAKERGGSEPHYVYPLVAWALETIEAEWATGEQRVFGLIDLPGDGVVDAESHPTFFSYRYDAAANGA